VLEAVFVLLESPSPSRRIFIGFCWTLASHRKGKPVRQVWQTGQAGSVQKLPKNLLKTCLKNLSSFEKE
jgi:hypothetical protein